MKGDIYRLAGRDYIDMGDRLRPAICGGYEAIGGIAGIAAIVGATAAVAGAGVGAYGAYEAGQARKEAAEYSQQVAENQAQASRDSAAIARANRDEELKRAMGAQRARIGATGVLPGEGSPLLVQMETSRQAALDLERITYAGETQATSYRSQGILEGFYGKQAARAGNIGAGTTLLSGVAQGANYSYGAFRSRT